MFLYDWGYRHWGKKKLCSSGRIRTNYRRVLLTWVERKQKVWGSLRRRGVYAISLSGMTTFSEVWLRIKFPVHYWSRLFVVSSTPTKIRSYCYAIRNVVFLSCYPYRAERIKKVQVYIECNTAGETDRVITEIRTDPSAQYNTIPLVPKMLDFPPGTRKSKFCWLEDGGQSPWMYNRSVEMASRMRRKDNLRTA